MDPLVAALRREHPHLENIAPVAVPLPRYDGWAGVPFLSARPVVQWSEAPAITVNLIIDAVCEFYEVRKIDVLSMRRNRGVAMARHIAIYLAHELTALTTTQIARLSGRRDHSTIVCAIKKIGALVKTNDRLADEIELLKLRLGGGQ